MASSILSTFDAVAFRRRLAAALLPAADSGGLDGDRLHGDDGAHELPLHAATPASVLIPIVMHDDAPTLLLTRRTEHLRDHPGQISFPGGRADAEDATPTHTALREAAEEIGLDPACVEVVGFLPEYHTITGYRVTPVVATLTPPLSLAPDEFEVAEIFEVPLGFVLDENNYQTHAYNRAGRTGNYYAVPWGDYFIWGATAAMLRLLAARLAARLAGE